jgi:tetratricopeptide (TPR) repeat protein
LENVKYLNLSKNRLYHKTINAEALTNLSALNLSGNQLKKIPETFSKLIGMNNLNLIDNESLILVEKDNIRKTIPWCEILFISNEFENNYFEIGQIAFEDKKYQIALGFFLKDIKEKNTPMSFGYAGLCYYYMDDNVKALEYLRDHLELRPYRISTIEYLSQIYFETKDYNNAYFFANKIALLEPGIYKNWYDLGWKGIFANKPKEVVAIAKKTLGIKYKDRSIVSIMAIAYILDNKWKNAEEIYKQWKGEVFFTNGNQAQFCGDVFIRDILKLEAGGIKHEDFKKVKMMFSDFLGD